MKNGNNYAYLIVIFLALGSMKMMCSSTTDNTMEQADNQDNKNKQAVYALDIPEKLAFAGEAVPTEKIDVREALDRELLVNTYWQSQTLLFIKRANRFFPTIEKILKENGIPDDFKYLAVIESGLRNVVSPAGASGYWQFMRSTGKSYNLQITKEIDERYHLEKATQAACRYLRDSYKRYKNWTLVAASYNMGQGGLNKQLTRQEVENYYDLLLNKETARYVYRILAVKLILSDYKKYGFHVRKKDLYYPIPYYTVQVDSSVKNFASFAQKLSTNYKILKRLNPWLRQKYLSNKTKKKYQIKIPQSNGRIFKE